MNNPGSIVQQQHRYFNTGRSKELSFRISQLKKLKKVLKEHEKELIEAVKKDFKKPPFESYVTEIGILYSEIDHILRNLQKWAKPERVWGSLLNFPSRSYIYHQPYGVSLVIGAWNYPLLLSLSPVLGSMAAGNSTLVKPSEIAEHSSHALAGIININFDAGYLKVVEGAADTTQSLLDEPLDYIFFTGSTRVGKLIMQAAARQLTPVTLELGGKSPAIVDADANISVAAKRIAWGKFLNAGQTCVAPDYVYIHTSVKETFLDEIDSEIKAFFGEIPQKSPDFARIINRNHFDRLQKLLGSGKIVTGGHTDEAELYIEPTVIDRISWDDRIMEEEIFGPILPVLEFDNISSAIKQIRKKPKPLALYLFSESSEIQQRVISEIPFGGGCINDTVAHLGNHNLPFGGVGESGVGNYHGKCSFEVFSHKKSIMKKSTLLDIPFRYAPYSGKLKWLKKLIN